MTMTRLDAKPVLTVSIVGGGFTGTAVALHLRKIWRSDPSLLEVTVFEPRAELGRGLAYDSADASWRINVPAGRMSLDPDDEAAFETCSFQSGEHVRDPGGAGCRRAFLSPARGLRPLCQ